MKRSTADRKRLVQRLKRIEGQVSAIRRMVEEDTHCTDVLVQIAAARGGLGRVGQLMLRDHINHCVAEAVTNGTEAERTATVDELIGLVGRFSGLGTR